MRTAALLLLMVGFLAAQDSPGSVVVVESQVASILSLLGLSGLAVLIAWLEREARAFESDKVAGESTPPSSG